MNQAQYSQLFNFLWNIANDVLVDVFDATDYRAIVMPMLTLRRIDVLLEPTKQAVLDQKKMLDKNGITNQDAALKLITKYPFYNTSAFTMKSLRSETNPARLKSNFIEYLNGFNDDVQDVIDKYNLRNSVDLLTMNDRLGGIIEKFTDARINLGVKPVLDDNGNEVLPGLDNHTMGTLFEELLRKFNESYAVTAAGRHFTPRDYVALLADFALLPVADQLPNGSYTIYDGACGTGGILTESSKRIQEIAKENGKKLNVHIFGQELLPETFATCKADLMIMGSEKNFRYTRGADTREIIAFGSTISKDGHPGEKFDFCISNPPFGTSWKEDLKQWGGGTEIKKEEIVDPRFVISYDDNPDYRFVPDIGDPQMLFLANNISRMKDTPMGTRIVEIHNGSSLFTGGAGGGESNLRRYILENDLLEAVVAMPLNTFYNTGISTYIWILSNRKEERRKGKVQLIDASEIKTPLRKNLGEKNCETNEEDRKKIYKLYSNFKRTEQSKIFDNKEFGYYEITVERPLRLVYQNLDSIDLGGEKESDKKMLQNIVALWKQKLGGAEVGDFALFTLLAQEKVKVTAANIKKVRAVLGTKNAEADVVYEKPCDMKSALVMDGDLRDTEQVPLLYKGGIDTFMKNEVLPYAPDALVDETKTKIGYELSFTKYFYKPVELRDRKDIERDILACEKETEGLLSEILG
ncbi:MAG: SAM-dependent DNA methyltransferase [Fibrobacter sp.]|nr:SAM-dependent DNA methyltransferase [Fibrobacter sp.]